MNLSVGRSWLLRGHFDLSAEDPRHTTTAAVRDALSKALGRSLRIKTFPVGPNWKHTFWFREGDEDYAEAQFFMRVDADCPILSLGVCVEKGVETMGSGGPAGSDADQMDRRIWDWQRLVDRRWELLGRAYPTAVVTPPVTLWVYTLC
jgi:hypothetical protein